MNALEKLCKAVYLMTDIKMVSNSEGKVLALNVS